MRATAHPGDALTRRATARRLTGPPKALRRGVPGRGSLGQSFHAAGDCSAVVADFNRQARAITERYAATDKTYDRDTGDGKAQGAVFP